MKEAHKKPLSGIRVVELTTYVAAPICGRMMADMGAEVVKIESPAGDPWRNMGITCNIPANEDENALFHIYNAGKKSVSLDLKTPHGMEALHKLLDKADVFITNTRPRSLKKLGLDYDSLHERYPKLIYATVTGYGEKGPDADKPGFDNVAFWSKSGFLTDMQYRENRYPMGSPTGIGDSVSGTALYAATMTALYNRTRTGVGEHVTISLYGTAIWVMASMLILTQPVYNRPYPLSKHQCDPFITVYRCGDGEWIQLTIIETEKYRRPFFEAISQPQLADDERFADAKSIRENKAALHDILEEALLAKPCSFWLEQLQARNIVCCRVEHFRDVSVSKQAWENDYLEEVHTGEGKTYVLPCNPLRLGSVGSIGTQEAPRKGENNREILRNLGYSDREIEELFT